MGHTATEGRVVNAVSCQYKTCMVRGAFPKAQSTGICSAYPGERRLTRQVAVDARVGVAPAHPVLAVWDICARKRHGEAGYTEDTALRVSSSFVQGATLCLLPSSIPFVTTVSASSTPSAVAC